MPITEKHALDKVGSLYGKHPLSELRNEATNWLRFAQEALSDGDIQKAKACIGVVESLLG